MTVTNDETRARISVLLEEILAGSSALWAQGIDPGHKADRKEVSALLKRITEQAYTEPLAAETAA